MFRASSAHLQEVNDVNCTRMQPLVFSFSAGGRLVHLLRGDCWSKTTTDCYFSAETKYKFIPPYHSSDSKSSASCHRRAGSITDQSEWDFVMGKVSVGPYFPKYFSSLHHNDSATTSYSLIHLSLILNNVTNWQCRQIKKLKRTKISLLQTSTY